MLGRLKGMVHDVYRSLTLYAPPLPSSYLLNTFFFPLFLFSLFFFCYVLPVENRKLVVPPFKVTATANTTTIVTADLKLVHHHTPYCNTVKRYNPFSSEELSIEMLIKPFTTWKAGGGSSKSSENQQHSSVAVIEQDPHNLNLNGTTVQGQCCFNK